MLRLFAFVLTVLGGVNWLTIGMLQYDFIAGIFGMQAHILSRVVYMIIGISCLYILVVTVFNKGRLKLFGYKKKKPKIQTEEDDF